MYLIIVTQMIMTIYLALMCQLYGSKIKHCFQVWHTRHRSIMNELTHLVSGLAAYTIEPLQLGTIKMLTNCSK